MKTKPRGGDGTFFFSLGDSFLGTVAKAKWRRGGSNYVRAGDFLSPQASKAKKKVPSESESPQ